MIDIHLAQIDHPAAWTGAGIGGREGLTHRLSQEQIEALDVLLYRVRDRPVETIGRAQFSDPSIDALMSAVRHAVMSGNGAIVLSGLEVNRYSLEDFSRLYWGLGTHLGLGVIQSGRGDHIGYVQRDESNNARGYTTDMELRSHTDFHEILSLASVRKAPTGGASGLVSGLAIHNVIARERPDLLAPLYRGHFQSAPLHPDLPPERVPLFCNVGGKVSVFFSRVFMQGVRGKPGPAAPGDFVEAMEFFAEVSARPDLRADFMLEPGEMVFWHNFQILHSREAFQDTADHKRLLLRLWLNVPGGRPLAAPIRRMGELLDRAHERGVEYA